LHCANPPTDTVVPYGVSVTRLLLQSRKLTRWMQISHIHTYVYSYWGYLGKWALNDSRLSSVGKKQQAHLKWTHTPTWGLLSQRPVSALTISRFYKFHDEYMTMCNALKPSVWVWVWIIGASLSVRECVWVWVRVWMYLHNVAATVDTVFDRLNRSQWHLCMTNKIRTRSLK